jgi:hypothetical protein
MMRDLLTIENSLKHSHCIQIQPQAILLEDYLLMIEDVKRLRKKIKRLEEEKHSYARSIIKINNYLMTENQNLKDKIDSLETEILVLKNDFKSVSEISMKNSQENIQLATQLINKKILFAQEQTNHKETYRNLELERKKFRELSEKLEVTSLKEIHSKSPVANIFDVKESANSHIQNMKKTGKSLFDSDTQSEITGKSNIRTLDSSPDNKMFPSPADSKFFLDNSKFH